MGVFIDITGKRFNRWMVKSRVPSDDNIAWWLCECDCGNTGRVKSGDLRYGKSKSCGCLSKEITSSLMSTHGHSKTRTYRIWKGMKGRCNNPNTVEYKYYGGRGIQVCDDWIEDYRKFLTDMGECPEGFSLEREDVNGNYEPSNCKWIPLGDQARNKRMQRSNTSGFNGIYYIKDRDSWAAIWINENGVRKSKHFSIKRYGDSAKQKANKFREDVVRSLQEKGVYYGKYHGKPSADKSPTNNGEV